MYENVNITDLTNIVKAKNYHAAHIFSQLRGDAPTPSSTFSSVLEQAKDFMAGHEKEMSAAELDVVMQAAYDHVKLTFATEIIDHNLGVYIFPCTAPGACNG